MLFEGLKFKLMSLLNSLVFHQQQSVQKGGDEGEDRSLPRRRLFGYLRQAEPDPCMHFCQRELPLQTKRVGRTRLIELVRPHVQRQRLDLVSLNLGACEKVALTAQTMPVSIIQATTNLTALRLQPRRYVRLQHSVLPLDRPDFDLEPRRVRLASVRREQGVPTLKRYRSPKLAPAGIDNRAAQKSPRGRRRCS